jgi:hypothetical protein
MPAALVHAGLVRWGVRVACWARRRPVSAKSQVLVASGFAWPASYAIRGTISQHLVMRAGRPERTGKDGTPNCARGARAHSPLYLCAGKL